MSTPIPAFARPSMALADTRRPTAHRQRCGSPGCKVPPKEGKAWCSDHITEAPYAASVIAESERREGEVAMVMSTANGWKKLDMRGPLVARIMLVVAGADKDPGVGAKIEKIARETGLSQVVVDRCVKAMVRGGVVRLEARSLADHAAANGRRTRKKGVVTVVLPTGRKVGTP